MKVNVKGHIRDLLAFRRLVATRRKRFARSPAEPLPMDPMNQLAGRLHPDLQHLMVSRIRDETKTTKTFQLVADRAAGTQELAPFRAGQYLSLKAAAHGVRITRPYSISSAPFEALGADGYYDITVRREQDGFLTTHMWEHWWEGTQIQSSGPCGTFTYEPLRDATTLTGLAGGTGITPFRSMAREIAHGSLDASLLVLYGSSDEEDIIFYDEFKELEEASDRIQVVHVLSCEEVSLEGCEQGFITAETIRRYANVDECTFFVCGPQAMYRFVERELETFNLPPKRVRREVLGAVKDITHAPGFPQAAIGETFEMQIRMGASTFSIPAQATETVLVAMERANLAPPSECRSGECGFCRSRLVAGEVFIRPDSDGRRAADKQMGYIHPCASYPVSDMELVVPRGQ